MWEGDRRTDIDKLTVSSQCIGYAWRRLPGGLEADDATQEGILGSWPLIGNLGERNARGVLRAYLCGTG